MGNVPPPDQPPPAIPDLATFDRRFAEVQPRLLRITSGLAGPDQAQAAVHETYLRARAGLSELSNPDHFDAWVARTAMQVCFNRKPSERGVRHRLRRLRARRRSEVGPRAAGLRELIEMLPPRERTVLVLHYGHGYQADEVAARVGSTPSVVRAILYRARQLLARQLRTAEG
jgi:RNA polymerase sigma factor (sigma-70 family)